MSVTKAKRYRLTVPDADESTQQWLAHQVNFSNSIRALIREDIVKNGYTDVFCRPVEQGLKRGRPTNAELERRELQNEMNAGNQVQEVIESDKVEEKSLEHKVKDVSIQKDQIQTSSVENDVASLFVPDKTQNTNSEDDVDDALASLMM